MKKILIVIIMAIVLCLSFALGAFAGCKFFPIHKEEPTPTEPETEDNGGMDVDENNIVENGIALLSTHIPRALFSEYDVMPIAESAKQLTATITPSSATYPNVEWTIAFKTPTSSWANGKKVTDYVSLTANGATATLSCKAAFAEQIIVTVTSIDNPSAKATCTVDYRKRVTDVTVTLTPTSGNAVTLSNTNQNSVAATVVGNTAYTVKVNLVETAGTLPSNVTADLSYGAFVSGFKSLVNMTEQNSGDINPDNRWTSFVRNHVENTLNFNLSTLESWLCCDDYTYENENEDYYVSQAISRMAAKGTGVNLGRWHVKLKDASGNQVLDKTFYFAINVSSLRIAVNNVALNLSNIEF